MFTDFFSSNKESNSSIRLQVYLVKENAGNDHSTVTAKAIARYTNKEGTFSKTVRFTRTYGPSDSFSAHNLTRNLHHEESLTLLEIMESVPYNEGSPGMVMLYTNNKSFFDATSLADYGTQQSTIEMYPEKYLSPILRLNKHIKNKSIVLINSLMDMHMKKDILTEVVV